MNGGIADRMEDRNVSHGIMFHHFHDESKHIKEQGSISQKDFEDMLDYYGEKYNLLCADEYYFKAINNELLPTDVCITFDDNLLCQYDVAIPVLNRRGLTAFFFAYTSPLTGKLEKLEVYRHFRHYMYSDIDDFYKDFFETYDKNKKAMGIDEARENAFDASTYLIQHSFYSLNDRKFRYLRDEVLGPNLYFEMMDQMIAETNYGVEAKAKILWCGEEELKKISEAGHMVGLHSHTHPTRIGKLGYEGQYEEYGTCKEILQGVIKKEVVAASYPCGSVNDDTEQIMNDLGIKVAFKERIIPFESKLMIPRADHADIVKEMRAK